MASSALHGHTELSQRLIEWRLDKAVIERTLLVAETPYDLTEATIDELETFVLGRTLKSKFAMEFRARLGEWRQQQAVPADGKGLRGELEASMFGGTTVLERAVHASGGNVKELLYADEEAIEEYIVAPAGAIRLKPLQEARFRRWLEERARDEEVAKINHEHSHACQALVECVHANRNARPDMHERVAVDSSAGFETISKSSTDHKETSWCRDGHDEDSAQEGWTVDTVTRENLSMVPIWSVDFVFKRLAPQDGWANDETRFLRWFRRSIRDLKRCTMLAQEPNVVHGIGTVAIVDLHKGQKIYDPTAIICSYKHIQHLGLEGTDAYISMGAKGAVMLRTGDKKLASRTYYLNEARSRAEPNVEWRLDYADRCILVLLILRDIRAGEELLVDYGGGCYDDDDKDVVLHATKGGDQEEYSNDAFIQSDSARETASRPVERKHAASMDDVDCILAASLLDASLSSSEIAQS